MRADSLQVLIHLIDAYVTLSDRILQKRHRVTAMGNIQGRFDFDELTRAVKEIATKQGLQEEARPKDSPNAICKVLVLAPIASEI